jgi:SAM-dependent methyltransferase
VNRLSWEDLSSEDSYDCVLAAHVVEHVIDPRAFVRKLISLLTPNGVLVLETPRTDDWDTDEHRYRDIYHTMFFDVFTLTLLVAMEGYRLVRLSNISFRNSLKSPNQINMQALFSRDDSLRFTTWNETSLNAMRAAYDSIDAEFMRLSRSHLSEKVKLSKLSNMLKLAEVGLDYLRKHGFDTYGEANAPRTERGVHKQVR